MAAALLPLVALPAAGASAVPPIPSPATVLTLSLIPGSYDDAIQGSLCTNNPANNCVPVLYSPLFFPSGVPALDQAIDTTDGQKIVFGYSQGGQVVQGWLAQHAGDADAPSPDELSFVLLGNATRKYGGANVPAGVVLQDSQYQVIDVARQYDYAVDLPDDPTNLLALANALAGFGTIHLTYRDVDIYDPANTVWTEGNITYVFVPTNNLPLLEPLRWIGLSALADQLNGPLKEIVEQAYDRPYLMKAETPAPTSTPVTASTKSVAVASTARVDAQETSAPAQLAPTTTTPAATGLAKVEAADAAAEKTPTTTPSTPATAEDAVQTSAPVPATDGAAPAHTSTKPTTKKITDGNKAVPGEVSDSTAGTKDGDQAATTAGTTSSKTNDDQSTAPKTSAAQATSPSAGSATGNSAG